MYQLGELIEAVLVLVVEVEVKESQIDRLKSMVS